MTALAHADAGLAERLAAVPLFAELEAEGRAWLAAQGGEVVLEPGAVVARQGEPADGFWVILEGRVEWSREVGGRDVHAVTLGPGDPFAELILILGQTYPTSGRALEAVRLFRLAPEAFSAMLGRCPTVLRWVVAVAVERAQIHEGVSQQQAKLVSLGTLAAGLAHELNNPASAAQRAAQSLPAALDALERVAGELGAPDLPLPAGAGSAPETTDALALSEAEDALADGLAELGADPDLAEPLAAAGLAPTQLDALLAPLAAPERPLAVAWLAARLDLRGLAATVEGASTRIAELVDAVKAYAYLDTDQGARPLDVRAGLETTLKLLAPRLEARGVTVERAFGEDVPPVLGSGGDLNQVWTALLDNAIDAVAPGGRVAVRTVLEPAGRVLVEVADDGPGVAPELQARVFEPFFTTKGVGEGTGLGLAIARRIVVGQHDGDLRLESRPGDTRLQVRLPPARGEAR